MSVVFLHRRHFAGCEGTLGERFPTQEDEPTAGPDCVRQSRTIVRNRFSNSSPSTNVTPVEFATRTQSRPIKANQGKLR
jgi:hypothetical protein